MSPATGIMLQLAACQDAFPIVVEQAEDEIAAANMIIGAAFAGARSITATSGGGFCLMTEAVGLAGITETPAVIINAQRPGPATGLATRTAQADLHFVISSAQDDFPRFVFAPSSPEEGYAVTARALGLAEKYQVPVIILVDQFFNDCLYSLESVFPAPEAIDRFIVNSSTLENPAAYKRYALTASGISPRALPCKGPALVKACGNEHREDGHTSEDVQDRNSMVDKRARKMTGMLAEMRPPHQYHADAGTLLIGWGSTGGVIREAVDLLRAEGIDAGCLQFCDIWPFPAQAIAASISRSQRFYIVEQNSTAQFARLLRQETGLVAAGTVLQYDGRPPYPADVCAAIKQQMR
jgi:2-oxoglutarate ferredoxin oxidoreductase subunit alpha